PNRREWIVKLRPRFRKSQDVGAYSILHPFRRKLPMQREAHRPCVELPHLGHLTREDHSVVDAADRQLGIHVRSLRHNGGAWAHIANASPCSPDHLGAFRYPSREQSSGNAISGARALAIATREGSLHRKKGRLRARVTRGRLSVTTCPWRTLSTHPAGHARV